MAWILHELMIKGIEGNKFIKKRRCTIVTSVCQTFDIN